MPEKAAQLNINEINDTLILGQVVQNVSGVIVDAEMGPICFPDKLITSDEMYRRIYGGIRADGSNKASYNNAIRALQRGTALRVTNIKHLTDVADKSTVTATKATAAPFNIYTLSTALTSGKSITATSSAGPVVTQLFTGSSANTLDLFLSKLKNNAAMNAISPVLFAQRTGTANQFIIEAEDDTALGLTISSSQSGLTVATTTDSQIKGINGQELFAFEPKYPGAKYNDLVIQVTQNVRGGAYFDISVRLLHSTIPTETYRGLVMSSSAKFLDEIARNSQLVTPVYKTITDLADRIPRPTVINYAAGTNGAAITETDIVGNSISKTGVYSFDGFDDVARIASFIDAEDSNLDSAAIEPGLAGYASARKDLVHFAILHGSTTDDVIAEKNSWAIDSSYSRFYADGLGLKVPLSSAEEDFEYEHALGDVVGAAAYSAANYKPWLSYANQSRGQIINNLGVGNTWGANPADLDLLAQNQINTVIQRNGKRMIWGNFTAQGQEDLLSYCSIRDLLIYMKKSLVPLASVYLEEPNDIPTWKAIYQKVQPWILSMEDGRAIWDARWFGDQDATSMDNLKINLASDVEQGRYRAKFLFKPINSLQDFTIDLVLTPSSATFEELIPSTINNQ